MARRRKKVRRPGIPLSSSSCSPSARVAASALHGPHPLAYHGASVASPSHASWIDWSSGGFASGSAHSGCLDAPSRGSGEIKGTRLGFPLDFIGAHSFPHFASFLSRLWSLPFSLRSSFSGGWFSSLFRPPVVEEEWPLPGRASAVLQMDPKGRNPSWERWGKRMPPGLSVMGENRNLSWRLKPTTGKPKNKEDIMTSSSGDGGQSGILKSPLPILKKENEIVCRFFCQKCGAEGHHATDCFKSLWCDICRKETHNTARCVLPKQNKPCMPIVGMAVDGLGFYSSHFSKPLSKKPKRSFISLVKVVEGLISAEDIEKDFDFHFP
jgi:hypothetical protein